LTREIKLISPLTNDSDTSTKDLFGNNIDRGIQAIASESSRNYEKDKTTTLIRSARGNYRAKDLYVVRWNEPLGNN
jgi:hypothetical protein